MPRFTPSAPPPGADSPYAEFIQRHEGWFPGSKAFRNNNPGNLAYAGQPGATKDPDGFAVFPDYKSGWEALNRQIAADAKRGLSIRQFTAKYARDSVKGNNPEQYARDLATSLGKSVDDPIQGPSTPTTSRKFIPSGPPVASPPTSVWASAGNVAMRGVNGALHGLGLPPVGDPSWKAPIHASDFNPLNIIKGVSDTQVQQAQKGGQALTDLLTKPGSVSDKINQASDAFMHAGGVLFPPIAPTADTREYIAKTGDMVGGVSGAVTNLGSVVAGARAEEPAAPKEYPLAPKPPSAAEANFQTSAKHVVEATQPGALTPRVVDSLRTVLPEYKAQEVKVGPITTASRKAAGNLVENKYNQTFRNYLDPAIDRGTTLDGNVVAQEKMTAIPESLKPINNPDPSNPAQAARLKQYQNLVDDANSWQGRQIPMENAYKLLQENNAETGKYHSMTGDGKLAADLAGRPEAQVAAEGVGLRKALYSAIDPWTDGKNVAESQGRYSDAITFRQQMDKLDNNIFQQPAQSALGKGITNLSDAYSVITGKGIADIAKRRFTEAPTIQGKIAKAFKNYSGDPLEPIPDPPQQITPPRGSPAEESILTSPSDNRANFSIQRSLFGEGSKYLGDEARGGEAIPDVGSRENLTLTNPPGHTPPLTQQPLQLGKDTYGNNQSLEVGSPQLQLTRPDPKTFDWQRVLFPESAPETPASWQNRMLPGGSGVGMPERPVQPPPVNP